MCGAGSAGQLDPRLPRFSAGEPAYRFPAFTEPTTAEPISTWAPRPTTAPGISVDRAPTTAFSPISTAPTCTTSPSTQYPARSTSGSIEAPSPTVSSPVTGGRVCMSTPWPIVAPNRRARGVSQPAPSRLAAPEDSTNRSAAQIRRWTDPARG